MTLLAIKDVSGAAAGDHELNEAWLERAKGEQAVHDAVVAYLANQRRGTAKTKTRSEVRGGGAKPWRQKGTGHARAGSNRSPLWRGGGVIFGPAPRSFAKKLNHKVRRLALRRAFTERVDAGEVIMLAELVLAEPKTKELRQILAALEVGENALIIVEEVSDNLRLSARNLPTIEVVAARNVNVYQMLLYRKIVISSGGLESLGARLGQARE